MKLFVPSVSLRSIACAALTVMCTVAPVRYGACEKLSYGSVDLSVDSVESAGRGLLKVEVDGETFLVSERDGPGKVLLRLLKHPSWSQRLPFEAFEVILRESLKRRDADVLEAAVIAGLREVAYQELDKESLWQELLSSSVGRGILVKALLLSGREGYPDRVCHVLVLVRQAGDLVVQESLANLHATLSDQCLSLSIDSAVRTLVAEGDLKGASHILESARRVFAAASEENGVKGAKIARGLAIIAYAIENSNGDVLASSMADVSNADEKVGVSLRKSPRVEELFASTAIGRKKYRQLLAYLPHFDLRKRTPRMHDTVLAAIRGVSVEEYSLLRDRRVVSAIIQFAGKDEEISRAYEEMIERVVRGLTADERLTEAVSILELDNALRGVLSATAFSPTRRSLIITIARKYMSRGESDQAEKVSHQWLSPVPMLLQVEILVGRFGMSLYGLVCVVFSGFGGLSWMWRRRIRRRGVRQGVKQGQPTQENPSGTGKPKTADHQNNAPIWSQEYYSEEYIENLRFFALKPDATLADIKHAYRQAVKGCHPDLNQGGGPESQSMFVEITRRYERLMALREEDQAATPSDYRNAG